MDVLTKYEHTPVVVAGVLRYTIQQWDDGRLVGAADQGLDGAGGRVGMGVGGWRAGKHVRTLAAPASLYLKPPSNHNHVQAAAVLGELAAVDPGEYERQQNASGEKAGVRSVAAFVKEMASCLPR